MLKLAIICSILIVSALTDDVPFKCATATITSVTLGGNLPAGATDWVVVPKNTNCTFNVSETDFDGLVSETLLKFQIPNGYALSLSLSASFVADSDKVTVIDSLGQSFEMIHKDRPTKNGVIWIASGVASINVLGVTGQSKFFAKYTYTPLNSYVKINVATGQPFPLSKVTGNTFYTITSANKQKVLATFGKRNTDTVDYALQNIYVYDGNNLTTAKMIGRLSDLGLQSRTKIFSSGSSLSLVNFYGNKSDSWVIGNDESAVKDYWKYTFVITSLGGTVRGSLTDGSDAGSAYTIYCTDCKEMYLNQVQFDSLRTFNNGYVTIQGQSPTHGMDKLLNYSSMSTTSSQFPQYIQSGMFTMVVRMSGINLGLSASNIATAWQKPVDGRKGYVFSANLWDPSSFPTFSSTFSNDTTLFNYKVNLMKTKFGNTNDKLNVKIGPTSGSLAIDNQYPRDTSSNGIVSANGNFLSLALSGSAGSDVRLSFEMKEVSASSAVGFLISIIVSVYYML